MIELSQKITTFRQQCEQIDYVEISTINNVGLCSLLEDVKKIIDDLIHKLYEIDSTLKKEKERKK